MILRKDDLPCTALLARGRSAAYIRATKMVSIFEKIYEEMGTVGYWATPIVTIRTIIPSKRDEDGFTHN